MNWPTAPVSRQAFLKGIAGMAVSTGGHWLRALGSPIQGADAARLAYAHGDQVASVTVDLSRATGKTIQPYLYGFATGTLLDDDFLLAANGAAEGSARSLAPALIRFNTSASTIMQEVFAKGAANPDWAPFSRWVQHRDDFLGESSRLIFGIGPGADDTSLSPATWAQYARATAIHFRKIGQEITYWEVGNECDPMGAIVYSQYFNEIADALHAVDPAYLVGGPVASWWNGIDLPAFISHSGARLGFIDFHSYPVEDTDSTQTAYKKAVTFSDVMDARKAMAGTVAARLPIGLLEYNMNGAEQPDGWYGLPAQGTITGAVYIALLLSRAFMSDLGFTMGGLWDLLANSNYGAIGNAQRKFSYRAIDEQGWYLRQAALLLPGHQVAATTTAPDLQVLATASGRRFCIQLVNYSLQKEQSVTMRITGKKASGAVSRWELSARYPNGEASTPASISLVSLPPQSIVMLSGRE